MIRMLFVAMLFATGANAATVNSFGQGSDGPSTVSLFDTAGPNDLVGVIEHKNTINWGRGFVSQMTFTLAGFGDIDVVLDTTTNTATGSPDSIRILSLPSMLRASSMFERSQENTTGVINLYYAQPIPPAPVPLPAGLWLSAAAIGILGAVRRRRKG